MSGSMRSGNERSLASDAPAMIAQSRQITSMVSQSGAAPTR